MPVPGRSGIRRLSGTERCRALRCARRRAGRRRRWDLKRWTHLPSSAGAPAATSAGTSGRSPPTPRRSWPSAGARWDTVTREGIGGELNVASAGLKRPAARLPHGPAGIAGAFVAVRAAHQPPDGRGGRIPLGSGLRRALRNPRLLCRRRCGAGRRVAPVGRRQPGGNRPWQWPHHHLQPPGGDRGQEGRLRARGGGHRQGRYDGILDRVPPAFRNHPQRLTYGSAGLDADSHQADRPARPHRNDQLRARRRQAVQYKYWLGHPRPGRPDPRGGRRRTGTACRGGGQTPCQRLGRSHRSRLGTAIADADAVRHPTTPTPTPSGTRHRACRRRRRPAPPPRRRRRHPRDADADAVRHPPTPTPTGTPTSPGRRRRRPAPTVAPGPTGTGTATPSPTPTPTGTSASPKPTVTPTPTSTGATATPTGTGTATLTPTATVPAPPSITPPPSSARASASATATEATDATSPAPVTRPRLHNCLTRRRRATPSR